MFREQKKIEIKSRVLNSIKKILHCHLFFRTNISYSDKKSKNCKKFFLLSSVDHLEKMFLSYFNDEFNMNFLKLLYISWMNLKTYQREGPNIVCIEDDSQNSHEKIFPLLGQVGECQYQNSVQIEKILVDNHQQNNIKIINQLCAQKGDILQKVTTIKFGNQIITIKDCYQFNKLGSKITNVTEKKRIQIFKKSLAAQHQNGDKTQLTKNLPKNFIKAFMNYLQDAKNETNRDLINCKLSLFFSKQKYNNSFIQKIIDDQSLQPYFRNFLENHAEEWILKSKIRNKKMHLEAINVFLNHKSKREGQNQKPDSTNSFSHNNSSTNRNENGHQFLHRNNKNFESNSHMQQNQSQRDSILANQSQDYSPDNNK